MLPIGVYHSQLAEVVPSDFRPVAIDQLTRAVAEAKRLGDSDFSGRVRSSFYDVRLTDDTLICDQSVLELQTRREGFVRHSLGRVNLAITQPRLFTPGVQQDASDARLESDENGILSAVFDGRNSDRRASLRFRWSLRGRTVGTGHEFVMRLPRSPQTRIVLSVPTNVVLETFDGVLRKQPNPPPDADLTSRPSAVDWYVLDAGGLSTVRLIAHRSTDEDEMDLVTIRQSSISYSADSTSVSWTHRMRIQVAHNRVLPPLRIRHGVVTSVRLDSIEVPFTRRVRPSGARTVEIPMPIKNDRDDASIALTIEGHCDWQDDGWLALPLPQWDAKDVVLAQVADQAVITIARPLQAVNWELPSGWTRQSALKKQDGATVLRATGPPVSKKDSPTRSPTPDELPGSWSRLRLADRASTLSCESTMRIEITDASSDADRVIDASIWLSISSGNRIDPLTFRVQRDWTLLSLSVPESGRVVEAPRLTGATRSFQFWPDSEDYVGDTILIHATGRLRVTPTQQRTTIPSSWFLRVDRATGTLDAVAVPAPDLTWTADACLARDRVPVSEIEPEKRSLLPSIPTVALAFRTTVGSTPSLSLEPVGVAFNVSTSFDLRVEGDEVIERFSVAADSPPSLPDELSVLAGDDSGRPPYRWTLRSGDNAAPLSLPVSDVLANDESLEQSTQVLLRDRDTVGRRLVGERRYTLAGPLLIELPTIAGSTVQLATAWIGDGLRISELGPTVLKVPAGAAAGSDSLSPSRQGRGDWPDDASDGRDWNPSTSTKLRYDPKARPMIVIEQSKSDDETNIVWNRDVTAIASASGTDTVEAHLDATVTRPFVITHDADLILVSVLRDGKEIDLAEVPTHPIVLPPGSSRESIQLVFSRTRHGSRWLRRFRFPRIGTRAVVMNSTTHVRPDVDTFVPASLLRRNNDPSVADSRVPVSAGQTTLLVPRNLLLSGGWLLAMIVFAISWFAAEKTLMYLPIPIVFAMSVAILWWPWHLAIIGWVIVPIVAAGMLTTAVSPWSDDSRQETPRDRSVDEFDFETEASGIRSATGGVNALARKAVKLARGMLWLTVYAPLMSAFCSPSAVAQDTGAEQASDVRPYDVLIPIGREGEIVGDKVYVPERLYENLFPATDLDRPRAAKFESAEYRVDFSQLRDGSSRLAPFVEAEYVVHVDGPASRLRLPFSALDVRRVWLRTGDQDRIVQFVPDGEESIVIKLPPGTLFRLRLTLMPKSTFVQSSAESPDSVDPVIDVTDDPGVSGATLPPGSTLKLRLEVPAVAQSSLTMDGLREEDRATVNEAFGRIRSDRSLRRSEADIGPVELLSIDFQTGTDVRSSGPSPLTRMYWINVGRRMTHVDCEIDSGRTYRFGDTVQLITLGDRLPTNASRHWRIKRSAQISESRWSVTFEKTSYVDGAIRMSWLLPTSAVVDDESRSSSAIAVPEVLPYTATEIGDTWIAINSDQAIEVSPEDRSETVTVSENSFTTRWSGYVGVMKQAFRVRGECPELRVKFIEQRQTTVTQKHHLHVGAETIQLEYEATIRDSSSTPAIRALAIPPGVRLLHLTVNGESEDVVKAEFDDSTIVLSSNETAAEETVIKAICDLDIAPGRSLRRPVLRVIPRTPTSETYVVTRQRDVEVTPPQDDPSWSSDTAGSFSDTYLLGGQIPVSELRLRDMDQEIAEAETWKQGYLPGALMVQKKSILFPSEQMIELDWEGGRWAMKVVIRFSRLVPAYVDVQIPTRWCESLDVSRSPLWSRQPSIDPSKQVVRISLDSEKLTDQMVTIRGELNDNDQGRVSVPDVRILGSGSRSTMLSVPKRLTRESIQWRATAVRSQRLPKRFASVAKSDGNQHFFLATGPSWSVEMANRPNAELSAAVLSEDIQVLPEGSHWIAACRWDVSPGGMESINIRIPAAATMLGGWTAGHNVTTETVEASGRNKQEFKLCRLPLSLSRLPQSVEALILLPKSVTKQANCLPKLVDLPLSRSAGRFAINKLAD